MLCGIGRREVIVARGVAANSHTPHGKSPTDRHISSLDTVRREPRLSAREQQARPCYFVAGGSHHGRRRRPRVGAPEGARGDGHPRVSGEGEQQEQHRAGRAGGAWAGNAQRSSYFVWEEGKPPDWVLEVASPSTQKKDLDDKRRKYAEMGVPEYWLFDPKGDVYPRGTPCCA